MKHNKNLIDYDKINNIQKKSNIKYIQTILYFTNKIIKIKYLIKNKYFRYLIRNII